MEMEMTTTTMTMNAVVVVEEVVGVLFVLLRKASFVHRIDSICRGFRHAYRFQTKS